MNKLTPIHHAHPDIPEWLIVDKRVPLGTEYMLLGYAMDIELSNPYYGDVVVDAYYVCRAGVVDLMGEMEPSYLPTFLFKVKES